MVVCLELGADLHLAQLMPLPLTVSYSSKIQTGFNVLVPAHPGCPGKGACCSLYGVQSWSPCDNVWMSRSKRLPVLTNSDRSASQQHALHSISLNFAFDDMLSYHYFELIGSHPHTHIRLTTKGSLNGGACVWITDLLSFLMILPPFHCYSAVFV